jgi:alpha(1,3/1,4) fucosyltransferase
MKKLGFYNYYDIYNRNKVFDPKMKSPIGDDLLYPMRRLEEIARERYVSVSTIDTSPLDSYDAAIFMDFPGYRNKYLKKLIQMENVDKYLFLFENEVVKPDNYDCWNYIPFKRVYTYNDSLVDNKRIAKFYLPNKLYDTVPRPEHKPMFCCMIIGNKKKNHPLELYSERIRAIKWFEVNQPELFDLYGQGWNRFFIPSRSSYCGPVDSKRKTMEQYKFAICYENATIPGYITEKIFDCFFAGCVPVYLGAPNVTNYIPASTFIDKRDFTGYSELFQYLQNMTLEEYSVYIDEIERFMKSDMIKVFGADYFADTILKLVDK